MMGAFHSNAILLIRITGLLLLGGGCASKVSAQNYYTNTNAISTVWSTSSSNWSGASGTPWDRLNGSNNIAVFTNTGSFTNSNSTTIYLNELILTNASSASNVIVGGGTLNFAPDGSTTPSIAVSAKSKEQINNNIGGGTITMIGTGVLQLGGSNSVQKWIIAGGGQINVNNSNAFSSSMVDVQNGVLLINTNAASNPVNAGAITLGNGTISGGGVQAALN